MDWLVIDTMSNTAPYEQIRRQIADAIRDGRLVTGARMPTVRGLAAVLDLAPNTVAKTYRELEQAGLIETRGRAGTVVAAGSEPLRRQARQVAANFAEQMWALGLAADEVLALAEAAVGDRWA